MRSKMPLGRSAADRFYGLNHLLSQITQDRQRKHRPVLDVDIAIDDFVRCIAEPIELFKDSSPGRRMLERLDRNMLVMNFGRPIALR